MMFRLIAYSIRNRNQDSESINYIFESFLFRKAKSIIPFIAIIPKREYNVLESEGYYLCI